jgi:hypothetical protein
MTTDRFTPHGEGLFTGQEHARESDALNARFIFPPFSVLDARGGAWRQRKRAWLALGIESEVGRKGDLIYTNQAQLWDYYREKTKGKTDAEQIKANKGTGTSVFDPVLCELCYTWFCPPGGQVVDPFAGGSVRGIVAGKLGYKYWGGELRAEQVAANRAQAAKMFKAGDPCAPVWVCGDSQVTVSAAPKAHFLMSCPPYGDLEKYSDDKDDLSNMTNEEFNRLYAVIIKAACERLLPGHLACFVVGEYRLKKTGMFAGFIQTTIKAFEAAGLGFYNDAVLVTSVGTLPIRVSAQFDRGKKLGRTHQNVLVFAKPPQ